MKKFTALLLTLLLLAAPAVRAEPAAAPEAPSGQGETQYSTADGSAYVLQEGGLQGKTLPREYIMGGAIAYALNETQAADPAALFVQRVLAAWDAYSTEINVSDLGIAVEEGLALYSTTLNSFPRYFDVSGGFRYARNNVGYITAIQPQYNCTQAEHQTRLAAYEAELARVLEDAAPWAERQSMTDTEVALALHDYIALHAEYCHAALSDEPGNPDAWNAYGLIVNKTAVCQGYMLGYMDLLLECGIFSVPVTSNAINHAWNAVEVEANSGAYYHVDVTWDDPSISSPDGDQDIAGYVQHDYFMLTGEELLALDEGRSDMVCGVTTAAETHPNSALWAGANAMFYSNGSWMRIKDAVLCSGILQNLTPRSATFERATLGDTAGEVIFEGRTSPFRGLPARLGGTLYYSAFTWGAAGGEIRSLNLANGAESIVLTLADGHIADELEEVNGKIYYLDLWHDGAQQYERKALNLPADLTGDGVMDFLDALALAKHLAGMRTLDAGTLAAAGYDAAAVSVGDVLRILGAENAA
jgi:hypothetical protein